MNKRGVIQRARKIKTLAYPVVPSRRKAVAINAFHALWRDGGVVYRSTWHGVPIYKAPTDLMVYQELLYRLKPDLIIETGTFSGGSALFMAHQLDAIGKGRIVTVEYEERDVEMPVHDRITYLQGSSTDPAIVERIREMADHADVVLVMLDSDHRAVHVRAELNVYADMVTPGSYLIVEDTAMNGHPIDPEWGPGPMEAAEDFLSTRRDFTTDRSCERYLLTQNPGGFLLKG